MVVRAASLDDKYTVQRGRVFMTGTQALVRLMLVQKRRDVAAGLNTAGFVSGYRGSPLGGVDKALWQARPHLQRHDIRFLPAVNEELAATAVLGSQQLAAFPDAAVEGVFALWYGKGPGSDRAGDALKHANSLGSAPKGGALVVVGDDHGAVSSSMAHQCEQACAAWMMPVLHPASVGEYVDYGLLGFAMSRFSGCYTAFKALSETVETAGCFDVDEDAPHIVVPDLESPPGGLHVRWPDPQLAQEERLVRHKLAAARAFARANAIDRVVLGDAEHARLGIVAVGKAWRDVAQALDALGMGEREARAAGIAVYKVGMPWPLEPDGMLDFAHGLEEVLVVEEKRAFVETQVKEILYGLSGNARPRVLGKCDAGGQPLLPDIGEIDPDAVLAALRGRLGAPEPEARAEEVLATHMARREATAGPPAAVRPPFFCAGCPHNTSTRVPEGSRALAGTGCHLMSVFMGRDTASLIHMGGEGINWLGQEPFCTTRHMFQNLGDGTYTHSGQLAIRQAVAAGANITYKILYNDAVAMTGGQPFENSLSVAAITHQVHHEGVRAIAVVSDAPHGYEMARLAPGTTVHHRDELDAVQRRMREVEGVSVIVYEQVCAAEKRRRRKRGHAAPAARLVINKAVCDGCGDCHRQSNCIAVVPVDTADGRKRAIDQSACNQDFTCADGFCPAFVVVEGGKPRRPVPAVAEPDPAHLPAPQVPDLDRPCNVLVAGIGGTGVVTAGQLLGVAALLDGHAATVLDFTGLAQKGGGVLTHVRLGPDPAALKATRIGPGETDVLLAGDMVVAAMPDALARYAPGRTRAVVNSHVSPTAAVVLDPDQALDGAALEGRLKEAVGDGLSPIDASRIAETVSGSSIGANVLMLGYAWQKGWLPLSLDALTRAITLNGVAVDDNHRCFAFGRAIAADPDLLQTLAAPSAAVAPPRGLDDIVATRGADLVAYQDEAYAARYRALVAAAREAERRVGCRGTELSSVVAEEFYRLMAYKDEFEVARRLCDEGFLAELGESFEGPLRLSFQFAPPWLPMRDRLTGRLRTRRFSGAWTLPALKLLARMKGLRGTAFDPFAHQAARRQERRLVTLYEQALLGALETLNAANFDDVLALARACALVRGYGPNKEKAMQEAERILVEQVAGVTPGHPPAVAAE